MKKLYLMILMAISTGQVLGTNLVTTNSNSRPKITHLSLRNNLKDSLVPHWATLCSIAFLADACRNHIHSEAQREALHLACGLVKYTIFPIGVLVVAIDLYADYLIETNQFHKF